MDIRPVGAEVARAADIDAITGVVADLEAAQQRERPADFAHLFQADAVWVTAHGKRLTGRDEISAFTHRVLPGAMRTSTATYEIVRILFVRPDVAVVNARQQPITLDGRPIDIQPQGSPVLVLADNDGTWQIAAGQNTQIKDP
ncbi:MAG: SgcJ/EcaC family oxidoreductase [Egibacteraceae bacterium]